MQTQTWFRLFSLANNIFPLPPGLSPASIHLSLEMKPILFVSGRTSPNPKDPKDSIKAHSFVYVTNSLHDCGKCPRYLGLSFLICKQAIRLIVAFNYETVNEFFVTPPPLAYRPPDLVDSSQLSLTCDGGFSDPELDIRSTETRTACCLSYTCLTHLIHPLSIPYRTLSESLTYLNSENSYSWMRENI